MAAGSDEKILQEARDKFDLAVEAEADNRADALDDIRFARLSEQWPEEIRRQREREQRPCLTINRLPTFIRQVVNDARQNKPSIKVHPADSNADPATAEIIAGLIRNIEYTSNADVAYDTGIENSVTCGVGYWRVGVDYSYDDTFDLDIKIDRIANVFSVYGDPHATCADSSDWNTAFVTERISKEEFRRRYKGSEEVDWEAAGYAGLEDPWYCDDSVLIAEYWTREEDVKIVVQLSDGSVMDNDRFRDAEAVLASTGLMVVAEREVRSYKVKQRIISGAEVLEENDWPGKFIPIIPVYGDEINVDGRRVFKSLIRDAKDPQRMLNYWRTTSTEMVALAPKTPFIGPVGSFRSDVDKWNTANVQSHAFIEYDGATPPQRQPYAGPAAGAIKEALSASDDLKSIIGIYDAALGARSNETSGRAIMARQRESDVGTFHFIDNLSRSIRHTGRILIDLIPKIYTGERVIRVLGQEGKDPQTAQLGKAQSIPGLERIYDLTLGKYDLVVTSGPSFTTRREEAATQMMELLRVYPPAAPIIGDLLISNMDWPGAEEVAQRIKAMMPQPQSQQQGQERQMVAQLQQQIQQMAAQLQQQAQGIEQAKADKQIEFDKVRVDMYNAETKRMQVVSSQNRGLF